MQNKPNFGNDKMNINTFITMRYGNLDALMGAKTKPKQTQFKPNKANNKANKAKNKANSNPILKIRIFRSVLCKMPKRLIGPYSNLMEMLKKVDNS